MLNLFQKKLMYNSVS